MGDRLVLLECLCKRWGWDSESASTTFAGSGNRSALSQAMFHDKWLSPEGGAKKRKSEVMANPSDSANVRAWQPVWAAMQGKAAHSTLEQVLGFYLGSLNGTGTVERWFSKIQMSEVKRRRTQL